MKPGAGGADDHPDMARRDSDSFPGRGRRRGGDSVVIRGQVQRRYSELVADGPASDPPAAGTGDIASE
jgi:hypothetical protein